MILARYSALPQVVVTSLQVELGALQQHGQRPGVVDVVADIGVEDDRDLGRRRRAEDRGHQQRYSQRQQRA